MILEGINIKSKTFRELESDIVELREQLEQAEQTLHAIRNGKVDALVIAGPEGDQVYTLRGTDHPYRALVEDMNEGALTLSADGTLLYCNRRFAEMLKLPLAQVLGEPFERFVAPEERVKTEQILQQALRGSSKGEITLLAADDTRLVADLSLHRMIIEGAQSLSAVVMDITAHKRAETQARANAAQAEALARVASRLNAQLDFDAVLQIVCEEVTHALNVPAATVTSFDEKRQCYILAAQCGLPPAFAERSQPVARTTIEGNFRPGGPVLVIPDVRAQPDLPEANLYDEFGLRSLAVAAMWHKGELFGTLSAITIGEPHRFGDSELALLQGLADQAAQASANARLHEQIQLHAAELEQRVAERTAELEAINQRLKNEIAERTRTEEALKASEERFRLALMDSRITVFHQDLDLKYTWVYNAPSGFDPEEIICRTDAELWPPEQAARLQALKRPALENGASGRGEVILHAGQDTHVFDMTVEPQRDAAGHIIGITSVAVDISDRKQSEEALQQANQNLMNWASELEQRNLEISQLNEMGDLLQSCLTLEEAYRVISQAARHLFPDDAGALFVLNDSKILVEAAATWGELGGDSFEHVFASENCWALRRGRIHIVADSRTGLLCEHLHPKLPSEPFSSMCVPMMAQGETLGTLYLQSGPAQPGASEKGLRTLTESKQRLAVSIAEHVALALSSLHLRETLQRQAIRDSLTGLFNRRYMEESLERELRRATRKQSTVGIIMLDLDYFKHFNDAFGHQVGDTILRDFGDFLKGHVRGSDVACRYGGEEFTLILPETSLDEACERAEQIRQELKFREVQHNGQVYSNLSVSLGVAAYPQHAETADAILQAADAALYRAKAEGRDRVLVAEIAKEEQVQHEPDS